MQKGMFTSSFGHCCDCTKLSRCSIVTEFQPQTGKPPGTLRGTVGPHQPRSRDVDIYHPSKRLDSSLRIRLNTSLYQYLSACQTAPHKYSVVLHRNGCSMQISCIIAMYSYCWLLSECRVCCLRAYRPFAFSPTFARVFPNRLPFSSLLFPCFSTTVRKRTARDSTRLNCNRLEPS
jgi:hypothetical protein